MILNEKGKILNKSQIQLPPGLQFGVTSNSDGKNNYTDSTNENRPIFAIDVGIRDEQIEKLKFKKVNAFFGDLK